MHRIFPQHNDLPGRSSRNGFTLVELLTTISIMVILGYLAIPGLVSLSQASNLGSNSVAVSNLLEQAYSSALSRSTYVWVGFAPASGGKGGVAMASVFSAHANAGDFPANVTLLTRPVILPKLSLATITTQISNPSRASVSVGQVIGADLGTFTVQIAGAPQTFSNVVEITPSGQVFTSSTNRYAWMEIGLAQANGNSHSVSVLQMNAFTGRVSIYQP